MQTDLSERKSAAMNYAPRHMYVWDAWYMQRGEDIHAYHLQRKRPNTPISEDLQKCLGHAVSQDLIHWEERPDAFGPDPDNPHDDSTPWTGCALWHEDKGYLYYTMRGERENKQVQRIGLAMTTDPDRWKRYPENPVIAPDPKWYATVGNPIPDTRDCRDLIVIPDPESPAWLGFYVTRKPGKELPETCVIACIRSKDLIHWEHCPPAFAPEKYATIEVPDVFELNGRWYLTCLTGNGYGNRGIWSDPNLTQGTMYAVADQPEGPYEELSDNALVAGCTSAPISCRSVVLEGERYVLYTDRERKEHLDHERLVHGSLSTPKVLRTNGDRLVAAYSDRIVSCVREERIGPQAGYPQSDEKAWGHAWHWNMPTAHWQGTDRIQGASRTGWGVRLFEVEEESFLFESDIVIESGVAAGLAMRIQNGRGAIIGLDAEQQQIFFAETPDFYLLEKRQTEIPLRKPINLKVVNRLEHVELYVNDGLRLAFCRYRGIGGKVGLFVDRGSATFQNIRLRSLNVVRPA